MNPPLGELHIDVTGHCNLACSYCYFYRGEQQQREVPDPDEARLRGLIDEAEALGCGEITLTGGEPLLRPEIIGLLEHGRSLKTLLTNGLLLDRRRVEELARIETLKEVKVSLDGFAGHDRARGAGSSARIRANLEHLDAATEIPFVINTLLTRHNLADLPALYDWVSRSSCYRWAIDVPAPTGRAAADGGAPYGEELWRAVEQLIQRFLEDGAPFKLHVMNIFHSELLRPEEAEPAPGSTGEQAPAASGHDPEPPFGWCADGGHPCDYYLGGYTVRIDGTLAFCPSLPLSFGQLGQGRSLGELLAGPEVARWSALRLADVPGCLRCRYRVICGSGCRADALLSSGSLAAIDRSACLRMRFTEERILPLLPERARRQLAARLDPSGEWPPVG